MYGGSKPTTKKKRTKAGPNDKRVLRGQSIAKIMTEKGCNFGTASKACTKYYNDNKCYY